MKTWTDIGGWLLFPIFFGMLAACPVSGHAQESTSERWQDLWPLALTLRPHVHGQLSSAFEFGEIEDVLAQARLETLLTSALESDPTPQTAHALGVLRLLQHNYDEAIIHLDQAAKAENDPAVQSDLAVSYLSRGREQHSGLDYVRALESAERALDVESEYSPAVYNRALALDGLHLGLTAQAEYEHFLSLSLVNPTGREHAAERLEALRSGGEAKAWDSALEEMEAAARIADQEKIDELVAEFPLHARQHAGEVLLPEWAELSVAGEAEEAVEKLTFARQIGQTLQTLGSDSTIVNTVTEIVGALARGEVGLVGEWRRALLDFREGRNTEPGEELGPALEKLDRAAETFHATDSSFAPWADFYLGFQRIYAQDYGRAQDILRQLLQRVQPGTHLILRNRAHILLGLLELYAADYEAALHYFETVVESLETRPASEHLGGLDGLLAETLTALGRDDEAWAWRLQALQKTYGTANLPARVNVTYEVVATLDSSGHYHAAYWCAEEMVLAARDGDLPAVSAEAHRQRGRAHYRFGRLETGARDFQDARSALQHLDNEQLRARMASDLDLDEGRLLVEWNPEQAIDRLERAESQYKELDNAFRLPELFLAKGRALEKLNRLEDASRAYEAAIMVRENLRASLTSSVARKSYFDSVQAAFDAAIRFQALAMENSEQSFAVSEQARARTLWDYSPSVPTDPSSAPWPVDQILREIPNDVVLIEYALLEDEVLIWILQRGEIHSVKIDRSEQEMKSLVQELHDLVNAGASLDAVRDAATELHEILLASSVRSFVQPRDRLVFIPDKFLFGVPFGLLVNPETGRLLVEDHVISLSPSATLFVELMNRLRDFPSTEERSVLAVGNPTFDPAAFPNLDMLPSAADEVRLVRQRYEKGRILSGNEATVSAVLAELSSYRVLHLATHVVPKPDLPELSAVLLAPELERGDGFLSADEVFSLDLPNLEIAVLSACRSVSRYERGREGVAGVARPFLAAGVPIVVASLWDVDDAGTIELMDRLHCLLAQGHDTASALRQVKLAELGENKNSPFTWAGFTVIGGILRDTPARKGGRRCLTISK